MQLIYSTNPIFITLLLLLRYFAGEYGQDAIEVMKTLVPDISTPSMMADVVPAGVLETTRRLQSTETCDGDGDRVVGGMKCSDILLYFVILPAAIMIIGGLVIWFIAAVAYKGGVVAKRSPFSPAGGGGVDFTPGLFGCCEDCQQCMHGCCCADVRIADTYATTGIMGYWFVVIAILIYYCLCEALGTGLQYLATSNGINNANLNNVAFYILGPLAGAFMATKRGELRGKLGAGQPSFVMDCLLWWWCACCVTIQEARQLDQYTGETARCCCTLVKFGGGATAAGGPVVVGQVVGTQK